ncbi:MAG: hypothetical protein MZV64_20800 [Ignavibacteriales bacterium]|nr:hypothetical protein [Ignavibacteriales bacterium]
MESNIRGTEFKNQKDYENAFRPTKWSIRAFVRFAKALEEDDRDEFITYAVEFLSKFYHDKDTINFVQQIREKGEMVSDSNYGWIPTGKIRFLSEKILNRNLLKRWQICIKEELFNVRVLNCENIKKILFCKMLIYQP